MTSEAPSPLFDRYLVLRHRARAKAHFAEHNVLFDETAAQLGERLGEISTSFQSALDLSPFPFLARRKENYFDVLTPESPVNEEALPYTPKSFDLIVSNLGLQWVNDLPGALAQCYSALKPGGLFLAALIGERSLRELRECLMEAELSVSHGASPRISPMVDARTAGALLKHANFHLPVVDVETVTLLYTDMTALMHDLRGMGQTNAHVERLRRLTRRAVFDEASKVYRQRYSNDDGLISASFDILYLHGWR